MTLAYRLLPELEAELAKTRKVLAAVPDGKNDFAAHPKSMPLTRLAGHTAELAGFAYFMLTRPGIDMQTPEDPARSSACPPATNSSPSTTRSQPASSKPQVHPRLRLG